MVVFIVSKFEANPESQKYTGDKNINFFRILRFWYGIPVVLTCFKEVYYIIYCLKPADVDSFLIIIDYKIFGVNPTHWVYQFSSPQLTEFLQIIYFLYYILFIVYGLELYLWKRFNEFKHAMFIIFAGFYICYIFYMIYPAIGPRFHLHDFRSINTELPGIFITNWIRDFLDFGESIPPGVPNPQDFAQRDAMPSAHITLAILLIYLSRKIKSRSFYFYLPYCILLIISTIYLRYHYAIDIAAGALVALITIWIAKLIYKNKILTAHNYQPNT